MILGVRDFFYNVSDMTRACEFYGWLLGTPPAHSSDYFSIFAVPGGNFALHWSEGPAVPHIPRDDHGTSAGGTITFESDDIAADRKRLESRGVKILGEADAPWGHMLVFEDPDGNVAKLMRPKAH